jgi:ribonuclease P protein component
MTKIYRLSRADFSQLSPIVREQGKLFTLTVAKSPDNKPQFACVVSKKTARRAHQRNLIKRRCRAAIREFTPKPPFAFVFTAKRTVLDSGFEAIREDVRALIVKISPSLNRASELQ